MIIFFVLPLLLTVVWSVFERTMFWMEPAFTLFSYENFFFSSRLENFLSSMFHSSISVVCAFFIGFPIAIFIRRRIRKVAQHRVMLLFILPFMVSEIIIGKYGRKSPVNSLKKISQEYELNINWKYLGVLGALAGILILSYYSVFAGMAFSYIFNLFPSGLENPSNYSSKYFLE